MPLSVTVHWCSVPSQSCNIRTAICFQSFSNTMTRNSPIPLAPGSSICPTVHLHESAHSRYLIYRSWNICKHGPCLYISVIERDAIMCVLHITNPSICVWPFWLSPCFDNWTSAGAQMEYQCYRQWLHPLCHSSCRGRSASCFLDICHLMPDRWFQSSLFMERSQVS